MADVIISPNMNLPVPVVGQDPGPDWANNINACLGILDQHNHSLGQGVQITPAGIDINADLPMNRNNLTLVNTVNFQALAVSLPGLSPNLGCIYVAGNELFYNDESGNVVEITHNGSVNAGAGSITGLPSGTASASYNSINQTFVFQSATSTPANVDGGSFIFRDITANSDGITISAPSGLAVNYQMTLPGNLPSSNNSLLTEDTSGNMSYSTVDGTSVVINGGVISTGPGNFVVSASSGAFNLTTPSTPTNVPNLSVTITTSGNPVEISLLADATNLGSFFLIDVGSNGNNSSEIILLRNGTAIQTLEFDYSGAANFRYSNLPPGLMTFDVVAAGTYTYSIQALLDPESGGGNSFNLFQMILLANEK